MLSCLPLARILSALIASEKAPDAARKMLCLAGTPRQKQCYLQLYVLQSGETYLEDDIFLRREFMVFRRAGSEQDNAKY
jgi:hypothetical protein